MTLQKTPTTIEFMIKTFRNQESKDIFKREDPQTMQPEFLRAAQRKLAMLDASDCREDLRSAPGTNLNRVNGGRSKQAGQHLEGRWWLRYRWVEGDVYGVDISHYSLVAAA